MRVRIRILLEVIKKNFGKDSLIYGDIREITSAEAEQRSFSNAKNRLESSLLLTGGFPCQPFSAAGKRRGTKDDRYLWPEMLRVIKEFSPTWIIGENVAGILTMVQQQGAAQMGSETDLFGNKTNTHTEYGRGVVYGIITDLEQIGYSVQPFVIPACAVNAPHRRDRVWIVAYAGHRDGQRTSDGREPERQIFGSQDAVESERSDSDARKEPVGDTTGFRCDAGKRDRKAGQVLSSQIRQDEEDKQKRRERINRSCERDNDASNPKTKRLEKSRFEPNEQTASSKFRGKFYDWETNWLEVATELCGVDDGLPAELDGFKLTKAGHRVERLKALGNAIVPQVAVEIFKAIKRVDHEQIS